MKVTQDEVVERQTVLHIEVDADLLERHMDRAYRRLVQRTNVPGFRKGKAPRHILERVVGRRTFLDEAIETLTPEAVADAIKEQDLEPAASPQVAVVEREPVLKLAATVALRPTVELGDYRALRFHDRPEPVTDEQVDATLERIRDGQASWEPWEGALEFGDLAVLTAAGNAGALRIVNAVATEYVAAEGSRWPVPGFAEALVGMSAGDSREFTLVLPEDFAIPDAAGQEATFNVSVSEVKRKALPPLDDELARNLGEGMESLADLRGRVRRNLEDVAEAAVRRSVQERMLEAIVAGATIELPPMLAEHEAQRVLDEQQRALAANNVPMSTYMERVGKSEDEIIAEAREVAERRLRRSLVIDQLAEEEGIVVPEADVEAEMEALRQRRERVGDRSSLDEEGARASFSRILRRQLVMDQMVKLVRGPAEGGINGGPAARDEGEGPETSADARPSAAGGSSPGGS